MKNDWTFSSLPIWWNWHCSAVIFHRDEEYDRGKKKKLRHNRHNFGGPNPFQEIASKKTKFKKAKMDQSRSGNKPFRIWNCLYRCGSTRFVDMLSLYVAIVAVLLTSFVRFFCSIYWRRRNEIRCWERSGMRDWDKYDVKTEP